MAKSFEERIGKLVEEARAQGEVDGERKALESTGQALSEFIVRSCEEQAKLTASRLREGGGDAKLAELFEAFASDLHDHLHRPAEGEGEEEPS